VCDPALGSAALADLLARLHLDRFAEVILDSFDARWRPALAHPAAVSHRQEYVVSIAGGAEALLRRCTETHRRHIRRGDRSAWSLQIHTGLMARQVIEAVHANARDRAGTRGTGFQSAVPDVVDDVSATIERPWGVAVFAAWSGSTLLSAALVGWAPGAAYCLMAGSSDAGYAASASTWLQHRIMVTLGAAGFVRYNLGGAVASNDEVDGPGNGLQRFKLGFGAATAACENARIVLRRFHTGGHELRDLLSTWIAS
jgi:hypothetical protein